MSWKEDYDYPMSHGCYRALCQLHGEVPPPNVDIDQRLKTQEEHDADFKRWQEKRQRQVFGYSSADHPRRQRATAPKPMLPKSYQSLPKPQQAKEGLKGIEL